VLQCVAITKDFGYRVAKMDALSCRSLFAEEPLNIGLFCGK